MSRSDGSARPPYPSDADHLAVVRAFLRRDEYNDEAILMPISDEQMRELEDAYARDFAGDVIQPSCMCGKWSSNGECLTCSRELEELERECREEQRQVNERKAWGGWKRPPKDAA